MKKIITILTIIVVLIIIFFIKTNYKSLKFGNNIINKSADEIKNYILDMNSYKTQYTVEIESNKNTNKYIIKEEFIKDSNISIQEVVEPQNIKGVTFKYDGTDLQIENSNLNLSKLYKNYNYIGESIISLSGFIEDFTNSNETNFIENDNEIILETKTSNANKYISNKRLFIDKNTAKPIKMEIQDITQNTKIYILYNEMEINNLQKEDVLAFDLNIFKNDDI